MIAQFWLWFFLSGLAGGIVGWWARGRKTSGRELKVQREWNDRLNTVEEHANRCLSRAREDAEASWQKLAQERDALQAELAEFKLAGRRAARFAATSSDASTPSRPGPRPRASTRPAKRPPKSTPKSGPGRPAAKPATNGPAKRPAARTAANGAAKRPAARTAANGAGKGPAARTAARDQDDLTQIKGVGPVYEQLLNKMGYTTFRDLAAWGPTEIRELSDRLGARIQPDDLVSQAGQLHRRKYGTKG